MTGIGVEENETTPGHDSCGLLGADSEPIDWVQITNENAELRQLLDYCGAYINKAVCDGYLAHCAIHPSKLLTRIDVALGRLAPAPPDSGETKVYEEVDINPYKSTAHGNEERRE